MSKLSPDEKWGRFNRKLNDLMKENDFLGLGITYYEMADFLKNEGKDSSKMRKLGYEMKLRNQKEQLKMMKSPVIKGVEIFPATDSCDECLKLRGKVFEIEKALEDNPLPVEQCNHRYGCRCVYLAVLA